MRKRELHYHLKRRLKECENEATKIIDGGYWIDAKLRLSYLNGMTDAFRETIAHIALVAREAKINKDRKVTE